MGKIDRTLAMVALCCVTLGCGDNSGNDNGGGPVATVTPSPTATAPPHSACPTKLTYTATAAGSDLDVGSTGIYFDQQVVDHGALSFALACPGSSLGSCGACALSGPIQSTTPVNNRRCQNATEQVCSSDADCPGSACAFFFGPPLPLSGGGVPTCITTRVGAVTGTVTPETGSGASDFPTVQSIFIGIAPGQPCPTCSGAAFNTAGTCSGGARDGQPCTVHGTSTLFGNTSLDCPPTATANIGDLDAPLNLTTGTRSIEPTETCTASTVAGAPCYCPGQRMPNSCDDLVCTVDASGEGVCEGGPVDSFCEQQPFVGCATSGDCPLDGDHCVVSPPHMRQCAGPTDATGRLTGPLARTGTPGTMSQIQVAVFCLAATRSGAINGAAGLPGPVTLRLPTTACPLDVCP
jgi:hypothetical protein